MTDEELKRVLTRVAAPLVESDHGELYWVPGTPDTVHLHLRGRFSGCPGNGLVSEHVLRPMVEAVHPAKRLVITSGAILPAGATRVESATIEGATGS